MEKTRKMQIGLGKNPADLALAEALLRSTIAMGLKPLVRLFTDRTNYITQTDGIVYAEAGFPVLSLNEHLHRWYHFNRLGYHSLHDLPQTLDYDFAIRFVEAIRIAALEIVGAAKSKNCPDQLETVGVYGYRSPSYSVTIAILSSVHYRNTAGREL